MLPHPLSSHSHSHLTVGTLRREFIKENKKVRKQEKKKKRTRPRKRSRKKENKKSTKKAIKKTRKRPRKKGKTFFFSWSLSWSNSCFLPCFLFYLDRFLGRVLFFFFSCFLTFLNSFINSHLSRKTGSIVDVHHWPIGTKNCDEGQITNWFNTLKLGKQSFGTFDEETMRLFVHFLPEYSKYEKERYETYDKWEMPR